jgi:hypothetical protein
MLHLSDGAPDRTARQDDASGKPQAAARDFYTALPTHPAFDGMADPSRYTALPEDWTIGLADVVDSTGAIAQGRYKAVNTAGAAVISSVSNALGLFDFPFVFGGDGASFAVGPADAAAAGQALAATVAWVGQELGLVLRGAMVGMTAIRAAGYDVKVARFAASDEVAYAMFWGGGRAWAERQMKAGVLALPAAPPGARPDLTGLSCRFQDIRADHGVILSLIVRPAGTAEDAGFRAVVAEVLAIVGDEPREAHPVPVGGPAQHWPPAGLALEARLQRPAGWPLVLSQLRVALRTLFAHLVFRRGRPIGGFSPVRYRRQMVDNTDFRKFDDGLMMTIDCSAETADQIEGRLTAARNAGTVRFGLHRQAEALVTCVVPSAIRPDHVHFVDGAAGGYAMAARDLKRNEH